MLDRQDKPLTFYWRAKDVSWHEPLGFPPAKSNSYQRARASTFLDAVFEGNGDDRDIAYSRDRNFYTGKPRYQGNDYSFANIPQIIDEGSALGWFEHNKVSPGSQNKWQSTFKATPLLLQAVKMPLVENNVMETIRLKDEHKRLIDYRDTSRTIKMRNNLRQINEAIQSHEIGFASPNARTKGHLILCDTEKGNTVSLNPKRVALYRVFNNNSFDQGGRDYGGCWQSIPSKERSHVTLDGEPTKELDYEELHPRMLYRMEGLPLPDEIYELEGWPRKLGKLGFNILLNATSYQKALGAIQNKIIEIVGPEDSRAKAVLLIEAIQERHRAIEHHFHTGIGLWLQYLDSCVAEKVMLRLLKRGVVSLPVHDSFIVSANNVGPLKEEMDRALQEIIRAKIT